ncbi:hypothetical protein KI387_024052, partial [Taxus chinensis]
MSAKVRRDVWEWQGRGKGRGRGRGTAPGLAAAFVTLLIVSSLLFLKPRSPSPSSPLPEHRDSQHGSSALKAGSDLKQSAIQQIESLFPKQVIDLITAHTDSSGPLSLNIQAREDLSSSWVLDERKTDSERNPDNLPLEKASAIPNDTNEQNPLQHEQKNEAEEEKFSNNVQSIDFEKGVVGAQQKNSKENAITDHSMLEQSPVKLLRRQLREKRREKRATELIQQDEEETIKLENAAISRSKEVDSAVLGKYSIWRRDNENENSDSTVRLMRDQLIMARVYSSIARARNNLDICHNLTLQIKESQHALGEANTDSDLHHSAPDKIKAMGQVLSKAREQLYDCATVTKKLRAMLQSADEQVRTLKKQSTFLSQLAAKTVPKGLHCLSMRLTIEYYLLPLEDRKFPKEDKLEDPNLYHYALFSDNVLAASVVVNSTIMNAKEPEKHVFHLVTDKLNFGAMKMWFLLNSPRKAAIHVENVDDYKWLNSSYCPVLRQLESAAMKEYYFKADRPTTLSAGSSNLKYRNPKYLSMLNHLRFYLPQVYPKLDKILFLDDDIVVQKDLSPLWAVDLHGKVNGAVETCGESFHRFDKYLNFSNPHIARNFDPNACGWAYGMNMFDLKEWKRQDITGIYHKWQNMNEDRVLWKLGTLPPG